MTTRVVVIAIHPFFSQLIFIAAVIFVTHFQVTAIVSVVVCFRVTAVWIFVMRTIANCALRGIELKFGDELPELGQDGIGVEDVEAF